MRMQVTLACIQLATAEERQQNLDKAERMIRNAAAEGAQVILLPELFATPYFCQVQKHQNFSMAHPRENHPFLERFSHLAKELNVVLPVSFYERSNNCYFNSIAIIDADGKILGVYRKSHIPDGPGYQEKFYFTPGDSGFRVFKTRVARIGVAICWDQWFPEAARAMALQGAEILLYPTAIGSEPHDSKLNSYPHWVRVMQGHAAANLVPVMAANRIGTEKISEHAQISFYGGSFIADHTGGIVAQVGRRTSLEEASNPDVIEGIAIATLDLEDIHLQRISWGIFRDRRIDLYGILLTLDGKRHRDDN